jgi:N-acyl-D-aspartate/D-glutamate deacylase
MNDEMQRVWEALRAIYGMDLTAATLVVLTKDGETAVKFQTIYFPQGVNEKAPRGA